MYRNNLYKNAKLPEICRAATEDGHAGGRATREGPRVISAGISIATCDRLDRVAIEGGGRMQTAKRLAGIELSDGEGDLVRLGSLWEEQPVVLVFLRHFG